jgi:hypothetical protein
MGCRSHRFNLAVEAFINKYLFVESELVGKLMSKLSTLKQSGVLRLMTSLRPIKRNVTRWTGVPDMFQRFERISPHLDLNNDEINELIPTGVQKRNIRDTKQALSDFKSVTISLQRNDMTIKECDVLFRSIIETYPEFNFAKYIGPNADIVHSVHLENAVLKLQAGKEDLLTNDEKKTITKLLLNYDQEALDEEDLSFAERVLKRQRKEEKKSTSKYIDTTFLLPTSCVVERLFSMAKRVFNLHRRSMTPKTLEALLFLNQNRSLWNMATIASIVNDGDIDERNDDSDFDDEY